MGRRAQPKAAKMAKTALTEKASLSQFEFDALIRSLRGSLKGKDSMVEALHRGRREEDAARERKFRERYSTGRSYQIREFT